MTDDEMTLFLIFICLLMFVTAFAEWQHPGMNLFQ